MLSVRDDCSYGSIDVQSQLSPELDYLIHFVIVRRDNCEFRFTLFGPFPQQRLIRRRHVFAKN